jgi:hypothetical protein
VSVIRVLPFRRVVSPRTLCMSVPSSDSSCISRMQTYSILASVSRYTSQSSRARLSRPFMSTASDIVIHSAMLILLQTVSIRHQMCNFRLDRPGRPSQYFWHNPLVISADHFRRWTNPTLHTQDSPPTRNNATVNSRTVGIRDSFAVDDVLQIKDAQCE